MAARQPARSARPPGENWQDSYFTLDERYRQLQQRFNAQERELKMLKVDRRKAEAPPRGPSLSSVPSARRPSLRPAAHADNAPNLNSSPYYQQHARGESAYPSVVPHGAGAAGVKAPPRHLSQSPPASSAPPPLHSAFDRYATSELSSTATHNQENAHDGSQRTPMSASYVAPLPSALEPSARTQEYVAVPSAALPQAARAAAAAAEALGDAASLPDPSMVWGTDGQSSMQNYVVASALYHANEELRRKLNESSVTLQTLQQELANTRAQHAAAQSRLEGVAQQMHQLVRERDLAAQKYTNAAHTITDLERTLRDRVAEEEKIRFSMESQITELRSRLVVGADSNELLQKDVRSLLTETRDRTGEVMQLRSKLALAESALSSQRNVNENMLVELKSLNAQLVEERRRLITVTREAQVASLSGTRIADLQGQLRRAQEERGTLEREHVGLMAEFVRVTEDALRHAREEVRTDVADWKAAAEHWERVSQLLYKDIAERTQQHLQCREECEAAKEQRDTAGQQLRTLKEDVALLTAKLHVAWPSHLEDAKGLSAADILNAFGSGEGQGIFLFDSRRRRAAAAATATAQRRRKQHDGTTSGATAAAAAVGETAAAVEGEAGTVDSDHSSVYESDAALRGMEWAVGGMDDFPADTTTAVTQLQELHEVNAALVAEVHQLRLTNEMLQDRLGQVTGRQKSELARVAAAEASLQKRERAGHQLLERQLDRVAFLEAQVKSLRGYHIPSNVPVDQIGDRENIFELFLGQLVAASVPEGVEVPDLFSQVFCSVDFLLHETITTPTVRGLNGFFDVTASFCVSMDALLFYYLHTRRLLVQLHRVRTTGEAAAAAAAVTAAHKEKTVSAVEEGEAGASPTPHAPAHDAVHRQHGGRGSSSSGGSSHGSGASTASHPSLRLAENMFETIAEGQVSLVEIIQSDECLQAARPTMRGHVRLVTPDQRHIASLEFRLTARRPYSPEFLQVLQEAAAKQRQDEAETAADGSGVDAGATAAAAVAPPLLEWMQATANASAEADLRPLSEPRVFAGDRVPSTLARGARREAQAGSSRGHRASPSRRPPAHMQLIPVSEGDDGTSSSSSFIVQHRSRVADTPGALVAHLPAPSPPPSATQQQLRSSSYVFDSVEGGTGRGRGLRGDTADSGLAGRDASASLLRPATPPSAFVHVDRSLLMQAAPAQPQHHRSSNSSSGGFVGSITCLWVDVERLELPADLPVPIPRLSCYFCVPALRSETWLAAPPTARYTWPYAAEHRSGASEIAVGTPLPISSVTQLAAVVREPLVLFFLDADAMATAPSPPPAHARSGQAVAEGSAGGSAVWAMAVCEWTQVAQQPNSPHHFSLPLLRRDQSLVSGAVVRLTLTATTAAGQPLSLLQVPPPLQHPQPNTASPAATAGRGASGVGGGGVDYPPSSSPVGHRFSPPAGAPPPGAAESPASMEEELLRLEYDQRLARSGL